MYNENQTMEIAGKLAGNYGRNLDFEDQEDVKQEIAIAIWQAGLKADESRNVEAFQFTSGKGIARNRVRKIQKYYNRFHTMLNEDLSDDDENETEYVDLLSAPESGFLKDTLESERTIALADAIESLPSEWKSVFRKVEIEGMTLEAFGKEQGYSKERARQVLKDAKERLANILRIWESALFA